MKLIFVFSIILVAGVFGGIIQSSFIQPRAQRQYSFGYRVRGDNSLANSTTNWVNYSRPQNVSVRYSYPAWGRGKNITHIQVIVSQSSNNGSAYITRGGIGQTFAEVLVEARNTTYYSAQVRFYGK